MILKVEKYENVTRRKGQHRYRTRTFMKCDMCGSEWITEKSVAHLRKSKHHVCSRECDSRSKSKGGVGYVSHIATNLERYGVEHTTQLESCKEKAKSTCLSNHGVTNGFLTPQAHDGIRRSCGADNCMRSPKVREKYRQTMIERYGVPYSMQSAEIVAKYDQVVRVKKCHETMKRNGTYAKSQPESRFFKALCDRFGDDNVMTQVDVNGWSIDFYIKSIDTYVQFDGVYWHGLNRPIDVIAEHRTPRDAVIHKVYLRDIEQREWFAAQSIRLVRVTDKQYVADPNGCIEMITQL